jgi:GDP-4-dehydro-6-deoxy-D-mannose reductase
LLDAQAPERVVNVCSGQGVAIRTVARDLIRMSRIPLRLLSGAVRRRAHEVLRHSGDGALLRKRTTWTRSIPWQTTLRDLLDSWRRSL